MNEIVVDDGEIVAMIERVEQLLAHAHQRRGAAGRQIEPAEQFQPARLGGAMQFVRGIGGRRLPPGGNGGVDAGGIVAEGFRQRLEEGDARPGGQRRIVRQNLVGQRHAGGLAAAGKQRLAQLDQTVRAPARRLAPDQGAAAVRDALQHLAEERGIQRNHPISPSARHETANDRRRPWQAVTQVPAPNPAPHAGLDRRSAGRQIGAALSVNGRAASRREALREPSMPGPLAGLRVLELARILAGPWAGQILADLGADVIKVERNGAGDDTRGWGPPFVPAADGGHLGAAYFHGTNRGKRSIELDFESEDGRRIVRKLAARSDVLIENFKVGGLAKFGLDYESLAPDNPRLIYCSVTGFGQTGPYASRAGYDLMAQGMGGIMELTGTPDGEPMRVGVPVSDIFTGVYSAVGILAALARREKTGRGGYVDTALVDSTVGVLANQALNYLVSGEVPHRIGNAHPNITSLSGVSGRRRPHHHRHRQRQPVRQTVRRARRARACRGPGLSSTTKARLAHRAELVERICKLTARMSRTELLDKLEAAGVPAGPINDLDQVFADPQVIHRGMKLELPSAAAKAGTIPGVRTPIMIDGAPMAAERPVAAARRAHRRNLARDRRRVTR